MRSSLRVLLAVASIVGLPALTGTAGAQGVGVSTVAIAADHRLLSDRLVGSAARVSASLGGRLSAHLGVEQLSGDAQRTGIPCAGLIRPGTCVPEPLRDDARLTTVGGGLALRVLAPRQIAIDVIGDLRLAWVQADTRGLTSDRRLLASETLFGAELGVEGAWFPWARFPFALEAGVAVGGLMPVKRQQVVDGYAPFDAGFEVARLRIGVAWRLPLR